MLLGAVYRSEFLSATNTSNLNSMLKRIGLDQKFSHKCVVGDFNYRNINWSAKHLCSEGSEEEMFIDAVSGGFWHQHVVSPTRARGSDTPNLLDLVFTNEQDMVNEVSHLSPLGNSDHQVLMFDFSCYIDWSKPIEKHNFSKGNYAAARDKLKESYIAQSKGPHTPLEEST